MTRLPKKRKRRQMPPQDLLRLGDDADRHQATFIRGVGLDDGHVLDACTGKTSRDIAERVFVRHRQNDGMRAFG